MLCFFKAEIAKHEEKTDKGIFKTFKGGKNQMDRGKFFQRSGKSHARIDEPLAYKC